MHSQVLFFQDGEFGLVWFCWGMARRGETSQECQADQRSEV